MLRVREYDGGDEMNGSLSGLYRRIAQLEEENRLHRESLALLREIRDDVQIQCACPGRSQHQHKISCPASALHDRITDLLGDRQ